MGDSNSGAVGAGNGAVPENESGKVKKRSIAEVNRRACAWRKDNSAWRCARKGPVHTPYIDMPLIRGLSG